MIKMDYSFIYYKFGKRRLKKWCRKLHIFRLCLAHPYPDDMNPDRFVAIISFSSQEKLENIMKELDISLKLPYPDFVPFKKYNENHSAGWTLINNTLCLLDINKIRKTITIEVVGSNDDKFKLDANTFNRAFNIEQFLATKNLQFIDPPEDDSRYCVAPKYYPKIWK